MPLIAARLRKLEFVSEGGWGSVWGGRHDVSILVRSLNRRWGRLRELEPLSVDVLEGWERLLVDVAEAAMYVPWGTAGGTADNGLVPHPPSSIKFETEELAEKFD